MVQLNSRVSAVILSRGSTWSPQPHEAPYLLPDVGQVWPTATASCVFYDTSGGTLATVSGTVTATGITFTAAPAVVDLIPAGSNFEIFLTVSGSPYQVRYGKVLRREAQFTTAPESVTSPLAFTDSWPTGGLRSTWLPVYGGGILLHDNSGVALANGVGGVSFPVLSTTDVASRWYKPLATDTASVKITALNRHTYEVSTFSKMRVVLAATTDFASWVGVEFHASADGAGVHSDVIHFAASIAGVVTYEGSPVSNVVANGDSYTIHYDDATATVSVYKGASTSPLGSWVDGTHIVPHGPGYRYPGLTFANSANSGGIPGLQATTWQAQDTL